MCVSVIESCTWHFGCREMYSKIHMREAFECGCKVFSESKAHITGELKLF